MSSHHSDQMSQRSQVSRVALCMPKVKVPGSWRLSDGSWRVSVGSWRLSVVPCLYLLVHGGYMSVPGGHLRSWWLSCTGCPIELLWTAKNSAVNGHRQRPWER